MINSVEKTPRRRAACTSCSSRKLRCTGEQPSCNRCVRLGRDCTYDLQKTIGRPRKEKRQSGSQCPSEKTSESRTSHLHEILSQSNLATLQISTTSYTATIDPVNMQSPYTWRLQSRPLTGQQACDCIGDSLSTFSSNNDANASPTPTFTTRPTPKPCACISTIYLGLDELRSFESLTFPKSVKPLRQALQTALEAIHCDFCPVRYLSAMQNAHLVGVLMLSVIECYSKLLASIQDKERPQCHSESADDSMEEVKVVAKPTEQSMGDDGFQVKLSLTEWKTLAKRSLKSEIHGNGENDTGLNFMSVLRQLEQRQVSWHTVAPPPECPDGYINLCTGETPSCLLVANESRRLATLLKFD